MILASRALQKTRDPQRQNRSNQFSIFLADIATNEDLHDFPRLRRILKSQLDKLFFSCLSGSGVQVKECLALNFQLQGRVHCYLVVLRRLRARRMYG